MKRTLSLVLVLTIGVSAFAQESDVTTIRSETQTVSADPDLLTGLWAMEDAIPVETNTVDLRLGLQWVTSSAPANLGDSDDDFVLTPSIFWGPIEDLELSFGVANWLGDGGDMGPFTDGNYDSTIGVLWRIHSQGPNCPNPGCLVLPSIALAGKLRIPTGDDSDGVDGELRLVLTKMHDNGVRAHVNIFGKSVENDNMEGSHKMNARALRVRHADDDAFELDVRHFQYGFVIGADGPLCSDGAVRWVADYTYRSSYFNGRSGANIGELGWEWTITDTDRFGLSLQAGLDGSDETLNYGANLMYSHTFAY